VAVSRLAVPADLGPIRERPGHENTAWGYWSTDALGLLEYLRMAEDVGLHYVEIGNEDCSTSPGATRGGSPACKRRSRSATRSSS
jgi:hypothetical protein